MLTLIAVKGVYKSEAVLPLKLNCMVRPHNGSAKVNDAAEPIYVLEHVRFGFDFGPGYKGNHRILDL